MKRAALPVFFLLLASVLSAWDIGVLQETSGSFQVQTVQAEGYWGGYQTSLGAAWTLGLDWNRLFVLRGGMTARRVSTSAVISNTVYPGYEGWGWTAAADWVPFGWDRWGSRWNLGLTASLSKETMGIPGMYRSFALPSLTGALVGEVVPPGTSGLALRLRLPVTVDQRPDFLLSWRLGLEAALVFRGTGWTFP